MTRTPLSLSYDDLILIIQIADMAVDEYEGLENYDWKRFKEIRDKIKKTTD